MLRRIGTLLLLLTTLIFHPGCIKPVPPPPLKSAPCGLKPVERPQVTGTGAVMVTDVSESMQGFVAPDSTRVSRIHQELKSALSEALGGAAGIRHYVLGAKLEPAPGTTREMDNKKLYAAGEGNLNLFLGANPSNATPQEAQIDAARIAVLVTDGMQSTASSKGDCISGADPGCIANSLKQRAAQGYGIWMALLRLKFDGVHFAEKPLETELSKRIQAHVATLGGEYKVSNLKAGTTSYTFQGRKPFLVLALSKDWEAGRNFMREFTKNVVNNEKVVEAEQIHWLELAPLATPKLEITRIEMPANKSSLGIRRLVPGTPKAGYFDHLLECQQEGKTAELLLEAKLTGETPPEQQGIQTEFQLAPHEQVQLSAKSLKIENPLKIKEGTPGIYTVKLTCDCEEIRPGQWHNNYYRLQAMLKPAASDDAWWVKYHAENPYEMPEGLFGLRSLVEKVIEEVTKEPRGLDCLQFRLERK